MATQIELLADLQILDQRLRAKTLEMTEGEARAAAVEEAIRAQDTAAATAREEVAKLAAKQRELEARLTAAEAKMKDRRMRITRIRNDKELGLAKREVELLKEETSTVESELVAVMEEAETASAKLTGLETELARLTSTRDGEVAGQRAKFSHLAAEIERERAKRSEIVQTIDNDLRRRYELIFSRRGGVAVVEIRGGICQGCRMRVPPQLFNEIQRNQSVILCPSCQRILFWRSDGEEASR